MAVAGHSHSLAILADGQVYAWGGNNQGQLGLGSVTGANPARIITIPCKVDLFKSATTMVVSRVAAGGSHSIAVTESGTLYSWGLGNDGQLGYEVRGSESKCQLSPRQVMGLNDELADEVACGKDFTLVLTVSGKVLSFGNGKLGALGQGGLGSTSRPMQIVGVDRERYIEHRFVKIAAGETHCLAATGAGEVFYWGNQYRELNSRTDIVKAPEEVVGLPIPVIALACGSNHSVVLCRSTHSPDDSSIYTWGVNTRGQLGYFYSDRSGNQRSPRKVEGLLGTPEMVTAGRNFTAVLMCEGEIYGWGSNSAEQFGSQPFLEAPTPVVIAGKQERKFSAIVGGPENLFVFSPADYSYSCATFLEGVGPVESAQSFAYSSFAN